MAKKPKLTRRQQWRIDKVQNERQKRSTKGQDKADQMLEQEGLLEGRAVLISHYGQQVEVELIGAGIGQTRFRCYVRRHVTGLVCGDELVIEYLPAENGEPIAVGVVVAKVDRRSELLRPDTHGRANAELKPVAANIDQINIVIAPEPTVSVSIIDRYLIACKLSEIEPIIIFNKIDLPGALEMYQALREIYKKTSATWLCLSAKEDDQYDELSALLQDKCSVFVGQSGVGKSSLINRLIPDLHEQQRIGEISSGSKLGKHTTSSARLFHFAQGGVLIDSPGIREFGLWHVDPERILYCYEELDEYLGRCKFRDCAHQQEPGCAIRQAIEDQAIHPERYACMLNLVAEASEA